MLFATQTINYHFIFRLVSTSTRQIKLSGPMFWVSGGCLSSAHWLHLPLRQWFPTGVPRHQGVPWDLLRVPPKFRGKNCINFTLSASAAAAQFSDRIFNLATFHWICIIICTYGKLQSRRTILIIWFCCVIIVRTLERTAWRESGREGGEWGL